MPLYSITATTNLIQANGQCPQNKDFIGRERELEGLSKRLMLPSPQSPIRQIVVSGGGVVGKSQLAKAFAYRHGSRFSQVVWWFLSENEGGLMK